MKQFIDGEDHSNEIQLVISEDNIEKIQWLEEDEIIYNGNTYDIVSRSNSENGSCVFKVIVDANEHNIIDKLINLYCKKIPADKIPVQFFKFISVNSYEGFSEIDLGNFRENPKKAPNASILFPAPYIDTTVPPPKTIL
jgi:hypothetical protein